MARGAAVTVRNPIGAGDALLAGLAAALEHDADLLDATRAGMAAAAAPVEDEVAGRLDAARANELLGRSPGGRRWRCCSASTWARRRARRPSSPDGEELAHGRAPTPWRRVPTGAEADPPELLAAAVAAAEEALAGVPAARSSRSASPAWARRACCSTGGRADRAADRLARRARRAGGRRARAELGAERFAERTGLPADPMYSAVKHRWLRRHAPGVDRAVRRLNVAEWIVRGLGGDEQTEWSLASRTGWLDLHARGWWDEALAWSGADASLLPPIALAGTPAGKVTTDAIPRARGAVLAIAGHDHLSAAVGAGAYGEGDVLDSCGTAETLIRASAPLPPDRVRAAVARGINVGWHAVAGRQCLLGSIRSGAGSST